jgi:hypothetical protein
MLRGVNKEIALLDGLIIRPHGPVVNKNVSDEVFPFDEAFRRAL